MENQRKKRKLMSSRSVPGASVAVVSCEVLINAGSSGNGGGGGGGGGVVEKSGGVVRGVGAMAAVRGRTLPRTGQRANNKQDRNTVVGTRLQHPSTSSLSNNRTGVVVGRRTGGGEGGGGGGGEGGKGGAGGGGGTTGPGNFLFPVPTERRKYTNKKAAAPLLRKENVNHKREDQDKENASAIGRITTDRGAAAHHPTLQNQAARNFKRVREKEGDGHYGDDLPNPDQHLRPPKVTALRMAKNAGESRIPLPGSIRASFLPKPKVVTAQHKVTGIDNLTTPQHPGHQRGSVKSLVESLNLADKRRELVTSTPFGVSKTQKSIFPCSPLDTVSCEDIGKKVCVGAEKIGILRYYGALEGETGPWCGIELPQPDGLNDGTVRGLKYFSCPANHGVMAPASKVRRIFSGAFTPQQNVFTMTPLLETKEHQVPLDKEIQGKNNTFVTGQIVRKDGDSTSGTMPVTNSNSSFGSSMVNSTLLTGKNDRPEVDLNAEVDWKRCLESTPNTSPVGSNHRQNLTATLKTGETNEISTNDCMQVFDDKDRKNSTHVVANGTRNDKANSKTPSPTNSTKILIGSRLVSPTIYNNGTKCNDTVTKAKTQIGVGDHETPKSSGNNNETKTLLDKINNETIDINHRQEHPETNEKLLIDFGENHHVNTTVDIAKVTPKPTGAIFKLNDTFINEKPLNVNNAALNLTNILYGDKVPVVEIPFSKRRTYVCGDDDMNAAENETFDKPRVVADLPSNVVKQNSEIRSSKENSDDTFLVEKKAGSGQTEFIKEKKNGDENDTFLISGKRSNGTFVLQANESLKPNDATFSTIHKNHVNNHEMKFDDTFFVAASGGDRRSIVISGNLQTQTRDSISGLPSVFNDSELVSQIKSVGDSCLIDSSLATIADMDDTRSKNLTVDQFFTRAFQDSKTSLIDAIGDSCLIETTNVDNESSEMDDCMNVTVRASVGSGSNDAPSSKPCGKIIPDKVDATSGPYSLLGLNGTEEDDELTPPAAPPPSKATPAPHYLMLNKQNSFEHDESLGILTPDQMAEFSMALECSRTPSCENLTGSGGSRIAMTRASASRPSDLPTSVDCEPTEGSSERTPSPEDLPLDPKPAEPTRTVPVSFITSVTSITSLEAGYQGDGENSRPASRGADPALVAPPPNLPAPRTDPMTDSDFFTESDADAHEEIGRGDRRAQVIDGTLFCAPGGRRCPSFTGEEMDSSGIYSDLDRRQDDQHHEEPLSEGQTPDTADTESQKSQPSPHVHDNQQQQPVMLECLQVPSNNLDSSADSNTSVGTMEATVIEVDQSLQAPPVKALNKSDPVPLKKYKMPKRNVVSKIKAMIESGPKDESEKEAARRPQRTPRKGGRWDAVMSKIEAGKNEQRSRPPRKEVKSRVLQSLGPPPTTANRRSPGDLNKSKSRRTRGRQDVISPTQETAQSSVHSSMSDISSAPRSAKKRLGSPGGSEGSAQSTPRISSPRQQQPPPSSLTIVNNAISSSNNIINNNNNVNNATVGISNGTGTNANNNINGNNNLRDNSTPVSCRPIPSHSQRSPTAGNPPRRTNVNGRNSLQQSRINNCESKKNSLDISRVNLEKSPSANRKPAVPRRSTSNVAPKCQSVSPPKDRGAKDTTPAPRCQIETREQAHQTDPTHEDIHLKQAEVSVQALSVIVQYLAHQLDGFSAPRLKKDCERMKTEWLEARLEAEELRAGYRRVEQQLTEQHDERQRALDQLRAELESRHAKRLTELETALKEEREKCEARLQDTLNNSTKELQVTIARLRTEHEADLLRKEAETDRRSAVHDQGAALRAEAESLRTVLELRSQEIAVLRAENDNLRREVEIKEALEAKVIALEARSEDLKAQLQRKETFERQLSHENKVLLESFHQESKQNKRLSQHNEELQWRLRQNNEVVTVLANQLATPPQRLTRSLGPEHITGHSQSPDDSPPASPMVKSMVEKSDSVSWTLEIEESPEAMASRLLRRSGSSRGISPSDSRPKRARQPSSSSSSSPVTAATVSRQSSLRTTGPQRAVVLRARSKSVSVADAGQQESWTPPGFTSTPSVVRRRPRSDPAAGTPVVVQDNNHQSLRPQEAGGEAMISEETSASSSSEDESSASSDIPRLAMELSWSESEG